MDICPFRWLSFGQADYTLVPGKPSRTQHSALLIAANSFFKLVRSTAHFMRAMIRRAGAITLPQNVGEGESGTVHLLICHIWGKGRFVMAMTRWREGKIQSGASFPGSQTGHGTMRCAVRPCFTRSSAQMPLRRFSSFQSLIYCSIRPFIICPLTFSINFMYC